MKGAHDLVPDAAAPGAASASHHQPVRILRVKVASVQRVRERDLRARKHCLRHGLDIGSKREEGGM